MSASTPRTATCACTRASIVVSGEPRMSGICHCANCRRRTGSAFGISAYFPRAAVVARAGDMQRWAFHHTAQDHDQERFFCTTCGTTLYWTISALPDLIGIAGGCFTEPALEEPGQSYSHAQKLPWVVVPAAWACMD